MEKKDKTLLGEIIEWIKILVTAFVVALVINNFIITNSYIPTPSMESNLPVGTRLFGFRLNYLFSKPKRGDVVIFNFGYECKNKECPGGNPFMYRKNDEGKCPECGTESKGCQEVHYIKRVIGLPGERIEIKADYTAEQELFRTSVGQSLFRRTVEASTKAPCGHVYINGEKLDEDYLNEPMVVMDNMRFKGLEETVIPDDCYFLMGDNRNNSEDARFWADRFKNETTKEKVRFVNIKEIEAKAYLVYWPFSRFGIIRGGEYDKEK